MIVSSREAGNRIIMNITDRDRSDLVLYPAMIAVVILSYLVILLLYVLSVLREYGSDLPPLDQIFGVLALLLMGVSILLAVFYLLMIRNKNHSKRESDLRKAMTEYIDTNCFTCGQDLTSYVEKMKRLDSKFDMEEKMGNPKKQIFWIALPALLGFLLMWIPSLRDYVVYVLLGCFALSIIVALIIAPHVTTFAREHDKRTKEFTYAFCEAYRSMGTNLVPTSKTVGYRSFFLFGILTVITIGAFSVVWIYLVFSDMNKHFMEQWKFEDRLLRSVRGSEIEYVKTKKKGAGYNLEDNLR